EIRGLKRRNNKPDTVNLDNDDEALAVVIAVKEDTLQNIERHTIKIERAYFGAIETLRKMQKDRLREERLTTARPSPHIGFVSHPEAHGAEPLQYLIANGRSTAVSSQSQSRPDLPAKNSTVVCCPAKL
ncbi:MAG TPA: hypothetical protein VER03_18915, partial [Bryobacteraceae bacterium]|nr:hypothetical protein [Bryobacteraceae bacterium]